MVNLPAKDGDLCGKKLYFPYSVFYYLKTIYIDLYTIRSTSYHEYGPLCAPASGFNYGLVTIKIWTVLFHTRCTQYFYDYIYIFNLHIYKFSSYKTLLSDFNFKSFLCITFVNIFNQ